MAVRREIALRGKRLSRRPSIFILFRKIHGCLIFFSTTEQSNSRINQIQHKQSVKSSWSSLFRLRPSSKTSWEPWVKRRRWICHKLSSLVDSTFLSMMSSFLFLALGTKHVSHTQHTHTNHFIFSSLSLYFFPILLQYADHLANQVSWSRSWESLFYHVERESSRVDL